jgi:hypothetical protein
MREEFVGHFGPWIWRIYHFISVIYHHATFYHNFVEVFHAIFIYSPSCANFLKDGALNLRYVEWESSDLLLKPNDLFS